MTEPAKEVTGPTNVTPINQSGARPRPTEVASLPAASASLVMISAETDLISRAKAGDAEALGVLAKREMPRVERLLCRILGPRGDLEDLVQTVFMELCRALPGFRGDSRFSTFVGGITVRVARRTLRPTAWARRRGPMPEGVAEAPRHAPDRSAVARDQMKRLHRALDGIKPKKRIAFTLWALEGLSPQEIATLTDTKVHTVRSRIFHARRELLAAAGRDPVLRELMEEQ